jgi:hypothetical protein
MNSLVQLISTLIARVAEGPIETRSRQASNRTVV